MASFFRKYDQTILGIIISGACWFLSCDLSGNFWYLLWIAPIPILHLSYKFGWKLTFIAAFTAYLIGRLSWLHYLLTVLPLMTAILLTLLIPLIFGLIIVWSRRIIVKSYKWWSFLVFPVMWTSFEYLLIIYSPDGSAGSIAYSQMNFLPVIQLASLSGITGVTFLLTLVPSAIAISMHSGKNRQPGKSSLLITSVLITSVLLFGIYRLGHFPFKVRTVTTGLSCMNESMHEETGNPKPEKEIRLANLYAESISSLATRGAKTVVLPEKIFSANNTVDSLVIPILKDAALKNKVEVILGYTRIKDKVRENAALVISSKGEIILQYLKVNLFEGEIYSGFIKGKDIGLIETHDLPEGIAICKDLDYQAFIRKYGKANIQTLYVPAWDFVQDGWLHSRMAIMRSVENGFPMVRCAREGRLTISDAFGRVTTEAKSENGKAVAIIGQVQIRKIPTIYDLIGDSFGLLNSLISLLIFIPLLFINKKETRPS